MKREWMVVALVLGFAASAWAAEGTKPSLAEALASLKIPPDWINSTTIHWDISKPWKEARLEVRRLLAKTEAEWREGVKITYLYSQKGDIGDGHELPMYLFMSGNYAWAAREFPPYLARNKGKGPTHLYLCYASCLAHFGEYEQALAVLNQAAADLPPKPWQISSRANVSAACGDLYADMGQIDKAKAAYAQAMQLYPTSDQPYGRHLLARQAAKVKAKLDMLTMQSLATVSLRDGTFVGKALGYADTVDMLVTVLVKAGRIADIQVKHQEKIDLNATKIIPQQIIAKQSLKVDAVTGATVTSQAIIEGTFGALKQAGLK